MSAFVILITGALTGIGRATALAFAREGATVVVSGRRNVEGQALDAELRGLGAEAAFIAADVRHEDEVRHVVDQSIARFGHLDVAVNNAGTEGQPGPLTAQTPDSYAAMLDRLTGTSDKKAAFFSAVPLKRGARREEIAGAVTFPGSARASFITGQIIRVNGGKTAS